MTEKDRCTLSERHLVMLDTLGHADTRILVAEVRALRAALLQVRANVELIFDELDCEGWND